jgi:hypothetical protein
MSSIIEVWIIRRVGGISHNKNLVAILADGTHICTCMETITKGIICRHFWRVMLSVIQLRQDFILVLYLTDGIKIQF